MRVGFKNTYFPEKEVHMTDVVEGHMSSNKDLKNYDELMEILR